MCLQQFIVKEAQAVLDPKIERLFRAYWDPGIVHPEFHEDDLTIDYSDNATVIFPDKDTVLKTTHEDVTWIDSYGTPHTRRAKVEYYPRCKIAFFDTEEPQNECYCESLL
nr:MAG TPA: hypothetical protein [Caudoviricetes sp.]